jgi:hypothetical protein
LHASYNYYAHTMSEQSLDRIELPADTNYILDSLEEYEISEFAFFESASHWVHHQTRFNKFALQDGQKQIAESAKNYLQAIVLGSTAAEPAEQVANAASNFIYDAGIRRREHLRDLVPAISFEYPLNQPHTTAYQFVKLLSSDEKSTETQVGIMSVHYRIEFNSDADRLRNEVEQQTKSTKPVFTGLGFMKKLFYPN